MRTIVHESLTEEEFGIAWAEIVDKYNLQRNTWIGDAWASRRRWAPVFWRGTFCAGMSLTQRREQSNRLFKKYVSIETGLKQIIQQFEYALKRKVEEEKKLNFDDKNRPISWDPALLIHEVYHKRYTNKKFQEVKDELYACICANGELQPNSGGFIKRFKVTAAVTDLFWKNEKRSFDIVINTLTSDYQCVCKLFEFKGILCRHIMRCLDVLNVTSIPDKYILDRWRKDIVRGYENIRVGYYDPVQSERVKKSLELSVRNDYMARHAMHDEEAYTLYLTKTDELVKSLEALDSVQTLGSVADRPITTKVWGRRRLEERELVRRRRPENVDVRDPPDKRGNGRRRNEKQPKGER